MNSSFTQPSSAVQLRAHTFGFLFQIAFSLMYWSTLLLTGLCKIQIMLLPFPKSFFISVFHRLTSLPGKHQTLDDLSAGSPSDLILFRVLHSFLLLLSSLPLENSNLCFMFENLRKVPLLLCHYYFLKEWTTNSQKVFKKRHNLKILDNPSIWNNVQ